MTGLDYLNSRKEHFEEVLNPDNPDVCQGLLEEEIIEAFNEGYKNGFVEGAKFEKDSNALAKDITMNAAIQYLLKNSKEPTDKEINSFIDNVFN